MGPSRSETVLPIWSNDKMEIIPLRSQLIG